MKRSAWLRNPRMVPLLLFRLALIFLFIPPDRSVASGVVTNCTEAGLRVALSGGGLVTFACDGTIVLTNTLLIGTNTVFDARGRSVSLSGNNTVRILENHSGFTLTLSNLTLMLGKTNEGGAAVGNFGGSILRASDCVFATNTSGGSGGAIYKGGLVVLNNCSFINNRADSLGGAIGSGDVNTNDILATNCTFYANSALRGGAIEVPAGNCWGLNCTFVSNSVNGIYSSGFSGTITLRNCIVAGSSGSNCVGVIDGGNNIISDASSGFTNAFSLTTTDPRLGPLAMNGGSTPTLVPLPDSPAIDSGDSGGSPGVDQRGVTRPFGPRCDVGAVETQVSGTQAGVLRFLVASSAAAENSGAVLITVARAGGSAGIVTVGFSATNGTAVAGTDYLATNGTLQLLAGESTGSFSVTLLNDAIAKPDRTVELRLTNPTGGASVGLSNAVLVIVEDDVAFSFGAPGYSVLERAGTLTIPVIRVGNVSQPASVSFAMTNGSAIAGQDFIATNGVLAFAAGQTNKTITIQILNDQTAESDKTATVFLSNPTGGAGLGANPSATLTILDDDLVLSNCTESALRSALSTAETVYFGCNGVIVLSNSLVITKDVGLDASGHQVTLSGGGAVRPFVVHSGIQFTLKNVTVADGFATPNGGGLLNNGSTRLVDCTFSNNLAVGPPASGGAIYHAGGALHLAGCAFVANRSVGTNGWTSWGGAVGGGLPKFLTQAGLLNVTNCTFFANSASARGAIDISCNPVAGSANILNSTFAGNTGGALAYCQSPFATNRMVVMNCVFSTNDGANCTGITDGGYNISSDASGGFTHPFSLQNVDPRLGPLAANGGPTLTMALLPDSPAIDGGSSSVFAASDQRGMARPFGAASDVGAYEFTATGTSGGVFHIFAATNLVGEAVGTVAFTVIRAGGTAGVSMVSFSTGNGTATAGADFAATNAVLTFAAGQETNTLVVRVLEDTAVEGYETFSVALSNPTGGASLGRAAASVIIADNDSAFQFSSAAYSVGEGAGSVVATVLRAGSAAGTASVSFATSPGTALVGDDFLATNGVLNFAVGQTNATFSVVIVDDLTPEPDESFTVRLSNPVGGASLGVPAVATVTLTDDDPVRPGMLYFSRTAQSVSESDGEVIIDVARTGGSNGVVSAEFFVAGGTATAADYLVATGTVTLADTEMRKSFSFRLVMDNTVEGPETVILGLRNPAGGATVSNLTTTITILDGLQTVNACNEGSLRAAVSGGGKVSLACDGTIFLSSPLIVSNGVSLDASGHNVTLSGGNATRLFVIQPGATLTLRNLGLVDGLARGTNGNPGQPGAAAQGGALCNSNGVLNAYDCTFQRHHAQGGTGGDILFPIRGQGGMAAGGAIYNWLGRVNASNCLFSANRADGGTTGAGQGRPIGGESRGGAVCNISGVVSVVRTLMSNNVAWAESAAAYGGAVYNLGNAFLVASQLESNSVFVQYLGGAGGGGLSHEGQGTLSLTDCTVAGNNVTGGAGMFISTPAGIPGGWALGGGLHLASGVARMTNCTIDQNLGIGGAGVTAVTAGSSAGQGGGVFNSAHTVFLNCTLAGNVARGGQGQVGPNGKGEGGGLYNSAGGSVVLVHATFADNSAEHGVGGSGGEAHGGAIASGGGPVTLRNSILARSLSVSNCFGSAFVDDGRNLSSDGSCPFTAPGSVNNIDPLLGPLASYGGSTLTMALLAGSPALDAASPAFCPPTDQRGRPRPCGAGCDIGAFESSAPYTVVGRISGFLSTTNPILVSSGASSGSVDAAGLYAIQGYAAGSQLLTPRSPECVFVLSNRLVNVGPDVAGVDFYSYRSNALVLERLAGPAVHGVFAGEAGQTYRWLVSPDLSSWTHWSTNAATSSGLLEFFDNAVGLQPRRFFRVVRP